MDNSRWIQDAVQTYQARLTRYAAQIIGDPERGRDVAQETFFRLCRQPRAEVENHVAAWLFTVCRRLALDVRRKEQRMQTLTAEQSAAQLSREGSQVELTEQTDLAQKVLQLVEKLSENQREVVRLKFQNGLSYREISQITQLSIGNVGYLLHTAMRTLREWLEP